MGDVLSANLLAAEAKVSGPINIGTEVQTSVLDLVEALAGHSENGFEPEFAPERAGEVRHNALETTRAQAELGWQSEVELSAGLGRTLDSLR